MIATAATPRHDAHQGRWTAFLILCALLGALVAGTALGAVLRLDVAWLDLAGIAGSAVVAAVTFFFVWIFDRFTHDPRRRHRHLAVGLAITAGGLLLWMLAEAALITNLNLAAFLAATPFTAVGLLVLHALQRYRREPWKLTLAAAGWGGVVATTLALLAESLYGALVTHNLVPGPGQGIASAFSAGLFEEGGKGVAVVLLFLAFRDDFDDVVSGIVFGAAVGMGFNFVESIGYAGSGLVDQIWLRQVLGLFTGHATYTALIGAGLGAARQQSIRWRRWSCAASGFLAAIAAHFLWDAIAFTQCFPSSNDPAPELLLFLPLQVAVIDGPWTVLLAILVYRGLREEGAALRSELLAECRTGQGAVTAEEVEELVHPHRRAVRRWRALLRHGPAGFRRSGRLQRAQLALAMERWHRARLELGEPLEAEALLRERVLALRAAAA